MQSCSHSTSKENLGDDSHKYEEEVENLRRILEKISRKESEIIERIENRGEKEEQTGKDAGVQCGMGWQEQRKEVDNKD